MTISLNKSGTVGVIIATKGRPECLAPLIRSLAQQTRPPAIVVVSATGESDFPEDQESIFSSSGLKYLKILGTAGSAIQRNRGIDAIHSMVDIILFLDDDFLMAPHWIERCVSLFDHNDAVIGMTGGLVADGAKCGSLSWEQAQLQIARALSSDCGAAAPIKSIPNTYGCNMAFRSSALSDVRFDERLVLYGWLEDLDFSVTIGRSGLLIEAPQLIGAHLGIQRGRTSGVRFGYSQVVNPTYLLKKGTLSPFHFVRTLGRPLAMNLARCLWPEPMIDRRGRLKGNFLGIIDLVTGRCTPEQAQNL